MQIDKFNFPSLEKLLSNKEEIVAVLNDKEGDFQIGKSNDSNNSEDQLIMSEEQDEKEIQQNLEKIIKEKLINSLSQNTVSDYNREFLLSKMYELTRIITEILYLKLPIDFDKLITDLFTQLIKSYDDSSLITLQVSSSNIEFLQKIINNVGLLNEFKDRILIESDDKLDDSTIKLQNHNLIIEHNRDEIYKKICKYIE